MSCNTKIVLKNAVNGYLSILTERQCIAFAACCCERLFPLYEAFHITHGWGDPRTIRHILDDIWLYIADEQKQSLDESRIEEISSIIPDCDDFPSEIGEMAMYAGLCTRVAYECCSTGYTSEQVEFISDRTLAAVSGYVYWVNQPDLDEDMDEGNGYWFETAPLYRGELGYQVSDLHVLSETTASDPSVLDPLRRSQQMRGPNPLRRGFFLAHDAPIAGVVDYSR